MYMAKLVTAAAFSLVLLIGALYSLHLRLPVPGEGQATSTISAYFQQRMYDRGVERIGGMPIEGFDATLLMQAFPGLASQDFDGVATFEGVYHSDGASVQFDRTGPDDRASTAEKTVSDMGYATLLMNTSDRLGMKAETDADIDALVEALAASSTVASAPQETGTQTQSRVEARIGQTVSALGVSITPLAVLEDSRCPSGVQCIWAGRVRVSATLAGGMGSGSQEFTVGQTITTEAEEVTLVAVSPAKTTAGTIAPSQYRFTFEVKKR
jgi:hypothetical protein